MRQNYSPRLEMQIPQEHTYTGLQIKPTINEELDKLSNYYSIRKTDKLKTYMEKHEKLIPYIHSITPSTLKYFPHHEKYLTFYTDPEYNQLNQALICVIGDDSLFEKEDKLMDDLTDELLRSNEFHIEVKNLISVRLWWL